VKLSFRAQLVLKRIFDVLFAVLLLILLAPLILVAAGAVWIVMGCPVIYRQPRLGQGGETFQILKFRTMNEARDEAGNLLPNRDRITPLGRFLRRTTLDEVPELVNVLKGEMSLVGPRPLLVDYRELYTPEQNRRHDMPPGMAGPVLAGGRNSLSWEEKFQLDLDYVENWSLWLDLKLLIGTAWAVLKREGISAEGYTTMPRFTGTEEDQLPPQKRSLASGRTIARKDQ
jgi:lipopolysaccharide/colanic/teichoic acid biosynthesis glycosyltransferase